MEYLPETNLVELCGSVAGKPCFSHVSREVEFFTFPLEVSRLSGTVDRINIIARRELLDSLEAGEGMLCVSGELRSFNNRSGTGNRLVITVYARELRFHQAAHPAHAALLPPVAQAQVHTVAQVVSQHAQAHDAVAINEDFTAHVPSPHVRARLKRPSNTP